MSTRAQLLSALQTRWEQQYGRELSGKIGAAIAELDRRAGAGDVSAAGLKQAESELSAARRALRRNRSQSLRGGGTAKGASPLGSPGHHHPTDSVTQSCPSRLRRTRGAASATSVLTSALQPGGDAAAAPTPSGPSATRGGRTKAGNRPPGRAGSNAGGVSLPAKNGGTSSSAPAADPIYDRISQFPATFRPSEQEIGQNFICQTRYAIPKKPLRKQLDLWDHMVLHDAAKYCVEQETHDRHASSRLCRSVLDEQMKDVHENQIRQLEDSLREAVEMRGKVKAYEDDVTEQKRKLIQQRADTNLSMQQAEAELRARQMRTKRRAQQEADSFQRELDDAAAQAARETAERAKALAARREETQRLVHEVVEGRRETKRAEQEQDVLMVRRLAAAQDAELAARAAEKEARNARLRSISSTLGESGRQIQEAQEAEADRILQRDLAAGAAAAEASAAAKKAKQAEDKRVTLEMLDWQQQEKQDRLLGERKESQELLQRFKDQLGEALVKDQSDRDARRKRRQAMDEHLVCQMQTQLGVAEDNRTPDPLARRQEELYNAAVLRAMEAEGNEAAGAMLASMDLDISTGKRERNTVPRLEHLTMDELKA